jgi:hypothetical protein
MKRLITAVTVAAIGCAIGLTQMPRVDAQQKTHKIAICHGTASASNPYVMIIVDASAVNGHFDGTAPGHGKKNYIDFLLGEVRTKAQEDAYRKAGNGACVLPPGPGS